MNTPRITVNGNRATAAFRYDPQLVALVKAIPGRRWDKDTKTWSFPAAPSPELAAFIAEATPVVSDPRGMLTPAPTVGEVEAGEMQPVPGTRSDELYAHQKDLIALVQAGARRIYLADEPGLGKTAQALVAAAAVDAQRVVVVAPAAVKVAWAREVERWWPGTPVQVLAGRKPATIDPATRVAVVNYDILASWVSTLVAWQPDAVVLDEAHYAKDARTKRGASTVTLAQAVHAEGLVIALSGTPVPNRPLELAAPLDALGLLPRMGGFWQFVKRYCAATKVHGFWDLTGSSNLEELHERLTELGMVRRRKADVLDLPARTVVDVPVTLDRAGAASVKAAQKVLVDLLVKEVHRLHAEQSEWASKKGDAAPPLDEALVRRAIGRAIRSGGAAFDALAELRRAVGVAKAPLIIDQARQLVDAGQQVVVMVHHRDVQEAVAEAFEGAVRITGGQSTDERQEAIDRFQAGEAPVLVGSITAAGVGITLTAASNLVLGELPWNAAAQDQAIDRIHRIGQDSAVTAWRTVATGTIDDRMAALIQQKGDLAAQVVNGLEASDEEVRGQVDVLAALVCEELGMDCPNTLAA